MGELAQILKAQSNQMTPEIMNAFGVRQCYEWAKEDGSLEVDNNSPSAKLKPFVPKQYVANR